RRFPALLAMLAVGALFATAVKAANTTTITAIPTDVPDEMQPRVATGDAPTGALGSDSWMNSATGKVNYYVTPTSLFGYSVNISDIKSISYWTKAPGGGGPASEN